LVELVLPNNLTAIADYAFCDCANLRCLILPPALVSMDATAFEDSTAKVRMLVVPLPIAVEIADTVVTIFGRKCDANYGFDSVDFPEVHVLNGATLQLVSAPDTIVASLGGVFAELATMTEVCAAGRAVSCVAKHGFWAVVTHLHQVCTRNQRVCAHTLLLVGARLYSQSTPSSVTLSNRSSQVGMREAVLKLPPIPDELWVLVLGWLQRSELGRRRY
jgi:TRAP-type mannitol/chloroaromatic compound transport system permease large subunit